ncbi:MAG: antirestriction protein [Arenicella sp.]|jgi:antirestriction protein
MTDIRVYVACLAAYNNGHLHGKWIDATQALDDIESEVAAMLSDSCIHDAEEYAIHDHEGFEGYRVSEYQGLESAHDIACFIEEYGAVGAKIFDHAGGDISDAENIMINQRYGEYTSVSEFAQGHTEETSEVPAHLQNYIDYESMGHDMETSGEIFTVETGFEEVHVFWSNQKR